MNSRATRDAMHGHRSRRPRPGRGERLPWSRSFAGPSRPASSSISSAWSPAARLALQAAQIPVSFRQQLQHLSVIIDAHTGESVVAQRRDRDRAGVVRIVLLRRPDPNSRVRVDNTAGTSTHGLARRRRAAGRAGSRAHWRTPLPTLDPGSDAAHDRSRSVWRTAGSNTESGRAHTRSLSIATAVCDALCGSIPIITVIWKCLSLGDGNRGGHS